MMVRPLLVLLWRNLGGKNPAELLADRAYDSARLRTELRLLEIEPSIRKRGEGEHDPLGKFRWPIERTFAHLKKNRRLRVRYERRHDIHQAFLTLACIKLCYNRIAKSL